MNDALLLLHLIGLMLGAAGGMSSAVVARVAAKRPPDQAGALRSLGPILARMSAIGLALMIVTGLTMVWTVYGGTAGLPPLFWVKMIFVLSLAVAAIAIELTYAQIKGGNVKAAARLPALGPIAGLSSLLAVTCSVFAFH